MIKHVKTHFQLNELKYFKKEVMTTIIKAKPEDYILPAEIGLLSSRMRLLVNLL